MDSSPTCVHGIQWRSGRCYETSTVHGASQQAWHFEENSLRLRNAKTNRCSHGLALYRVKHSQWRSREPRSMNSTLSWPLRWVSHPLMTQLLSTSIPHPRTNSCSTMWLPDFSTKKLGSCLSVLSLRHPTTLLKMLHCMWQTTAHPIRT